MNKAHDDLTFARYQGFYEYLMEGPDGGRTHPDSADWNDAYDTGRNDAEAYLAGTKPRKVDELTAVLESAQAELASRSDSLDGGEHTLTPGQRCWITVGNASVLVNADTEGVIVDISCKDGEVLASAGVHENDLLEEED